MLRLGWERCCESGCSAPRFSPSFSKGAQVESFPPTTPILHLHTCTLHNFIQAAGSSDTPGPPQISSLAERFERHPARLLNTVPNPSTAINPKHLAQVKPRLKSLPKRGRQTQSRMVVPSGLGRYHLLGQNSISKLPQQGIRKINKLMIIRHFWRKGTMEVQRIT